MDFGSMARQMVGLLQKFIVDPTLRAWVLPKFSTTTVMDTTVGAIMMSTLKAYFEYTFAEIEYGIPRVTLDGTKVDWVRRCASAPLPINPTHISSRIPRNDLHQKWRGYANRSTTMVGVEMYNLRGTSKSL
ncbi:hypothetical protein B0H16DRAFT_1885359 [Mycena metata]|uniref:Uncharacterized protein n=1 Tax=Mycena metata TaxID=1033252 RepID=A0AAD7J6U9_9AGAR|nr:hypothetical protein B0H16DRAFT_1885359 [Mycena metata]